MRSGRWTILWVFLVVLLCLCRFCPLFSFIFKNRLRQDPTSIRCGGTTDVRRGCDVQVPLAGGFQAGGFHVIWMSRAAVLTAWWHSCGNFEEWNGIFLSNYQISSQSHIEISCNLFPESDMHSLGQWFSTSGLGVLFRNGHQSSIINFLSNGSTKDAFPSIMISTDHYITVS